MVSKEVMKPDSYSIKYGLASHVGRRQQNQDAVQVPSGTLSLREHGMLFAVADGMGGHPGGAIASRLACEGLNNYYDRALNEKGRFSLIEIRRYLEEAIFRVDRHIRWQGLQDREHEDMGTTLSCLVVTDTHSIIAHVGDSRIYRLRNRHLTCLTIDHTFVQDMILEGEVDPERAHLHPLRHMLTRAVGTGESLTWVDTRIDTLKQKDCFLLCTDGLYNALNASSIVNLLSRNAIASETAEELVSRALQAGARDNITAIVFRIE